MLFAASPEWRALDQRLPTLLDDPNFRCVKETARTKAGFIAAEGEPAFVKRASLSYPRGLAARLFGSRARRALRGSRILSQGGFDHPRMRLVSETLAAGAIRYCDVVAEPLWDAQVLSRFSLGRAKPPGLRRRVSQRLGAELRRLHDSGVYTRDLQETNLMVAERDGALAIYFVDLEDFRGPRRVSATRRMRNLVHLDRSIGRFASRAQRLRFFYDYLGRRPDRAEARRLLSRYFAVRARVRRRKRLKGDGS